VVGWQPARLIEIIIKKKRASFWLALFLFRILLFNPGDNDALNKEALGNHEEQQGGDQGH
jgi:hypothetical protein